MLSNAKLAANRRNALKSTGPRTPEGKSRSSRNATTHALTSSLPTTLIPDDERDAYDRFSSSFLTSLNPQGPLELLLAQRLLLRAYQLHRCHSAESLLLQQERQSHLDKAQSEYEEELDHYKRLSRTPRKNPLTPPAPPVPPPTSAQILATSFRKNPSDPHRNPYARLQRYATTADLAFHRDLKQLLALQKLRRQFPDDPPLDESPEQNEPTPAPQDTNLFPAQPLATPPIQNEPTTPPPAPPQTLPSSPAPRTITCGNGQKTRSTHEDGLHRALHHPHHHPDGSPHTGGQSPPPPQSQ